MTIRCTTWMTALSLVLLLALPLWSGCGSSSSPGAAPPVIDLAVANTEHHYDDALVMVWLDVINDPATGRAPNILLDIAGHLNNYERPRYVRMAGEQLFVLCTESRSDSGQILIWNDFRAIEGNPPPDTVLDTGSGLSHPNYMQIHDGDLYVTNYYGTVLIFRDTLTLAG